MSGLVVRKPAQGRHPRRCDARGRPGAVVGETVPRGNSHLFDLGIEELQRFRKLVGSWTVTGDKQSQPFMGLGQVRHRQGVKPLRRAHEVDAANGLGDTVDVHKRLRVQPPARTVI